MEMSSFLQGLVKKYTTDYNLTPLSSYNNTSLSGINNPYSMNFLTQNYSIWTPGLFSNQVNQTKTSPKYNPQTILDYNFSTKGASAYDLMTSKSFTNKANQYKPTDLYKNLKTKTNKSYSLWTSQIFTNRGNNNVNPLYKPSETATSLTNNLASTYSLFTTEMLKSNGILNK